MYFNLECKIFLNQNVDLLCGPEMVCHMILITVQEGLGLVSTW